MRTTLKRSSRTDDQPARSDDPTAQSDDQATTERAEQSEAPAKSRLRMVLEGATVFVVMFVTLYTTLRWLLSRDEAHAD